MNLYPQHLRDRQHAEIIRRRSFGVYAGPMPPAYAANLAMPPRLGRRGKLWARGSGLTDQEAATGLPAAAMQTHAAMWPLMLVGVAGATGLGALAEVIHFVPLMGASVVVAAAALRLSTVSMPRSVFRSLYKRPLSAQEIDALLLEAHDEMSRAYLLLVRDAIVQTIPDQNLPDLQATIKALGLAVDHLPPITVAPIDTAALRSKAASVLEDARHEPDQVIAESKERRAEALNRRADAGDRSALLVRRAHALRAEITAQMDALREGLAGFHVGIADTTVLTHLADDARRVAAEATAVAQAREELDASPTRVTEITPTQTQQAGLS